jgi:hypothetical protein
MIRLIDKPAELVAARPADAPEEQLMDAVRELGYAWAGDQLDRKLLVLFTWVWLRSHLAEGQEGRSR